MALCWSTSSKAQTPLTVTGNVTDSGGNLANGTVEFDIQPYSSSIQYYVQGSATILPPSVVCNITNGLIKNLSGGACTVWGNDVISPSNTTYTVIWAINGVPSYQVPQICVTGVGTYSMNTPKFCPVVRIIPQYSTITAPLINGNLIPQVASAFTLGNAQAHYSAAYIDNLFSLGALSLTSLTVNGYPSHVTQPLVITSGVCTANGGTFNTCTMAPVTWPIAFLSTSYAVTCTGLTPTNGIGTIGTVAGKIYSVVKSTSTITISLQSDNSNGFSYNEIDCVGVL